MAIVLCDPNYRPSELYFGIESLLLFYDHVMLYAPSAGQIRQGGYDSSRLIKLIESGLIVPIGRQFWFNARERDELAAHYSSNPEKSSTYQWTDLDERILSIGKYRAGSAASDVSRGFVEVSDNHRRFADDMERSIPERRGAEFAKLVDLTRSLREKRRLPSELLRGPLAETSDERMAARLVFCAAGDLRLCENVGASSVFSTREMGEVYRAVGRSFAPIPQQPSGELTVLNPLKEYILTEEELQMAARLARQVTRADDIGPLDIDLLLEYRQTQCSLLFRDFVAQNLGNPLDEGRPDVTQLMKVFDAELEWVDRISDTLPYVGSVTVLTLGQLLLDERIKEKSLGRRAFITVFAALSMGMFASRVLPDVVQGPAAQVVDWPHARLFALVKKQRDRQRRRSGLE